MGNLARLSSEDEMDGQDCPSYECAAATGDSCLDANSTFFAGNA
jgi:hypothetical protein